MNRRVPQPLYDQVLELTEAIVQPEASDESAIDSALAAAALQKLVSLFENLQAADAPDPFLTETLADFTSDAEEAIRLYRLALQQSLTFPGEPTHTKRQGLVERLLEAGHAVEAQVELDKARREAFMAGDTEAIKALNTLEVEEITRGGH